jgi:hypothetical protein
MKKILLIVLVLAITVSFVNCKKAEQEKLKDKIEEGVQKVEDKVIDEVGKQVDKIPAK